MNDNKLFKTAYMCIMQLKKMHFEIKANEEGYQIFSPYGSNVFGKNEVINENILMLFTDKAFRYKRRNGLKKLYVEIPNMVDEIKANKWLYGIK